MRDPIEIPAHETGTLRVFTLDMAPEQAQDLHRAEALESALGAQQVDAAHVEIFPLKDLADLGLAGYLVEGCGIPSEQIEPDRARLDALTGHVMLLRSQAFDRRAVTLRPASDIRHVATYSETPLDWTATPMETDSARPRTGSSVSPRTARGRARRVGGGIFAVFMVLIVLALFLVLA